MKKSLSLLKHNPIVKQLSSPRLVEVLRKPWVLSAAIHLFLLLGLALTIVQPKHQIKWHSFEWEQIYSVPLPETRGASKADEIQEDVGVLPVASDELETEESAAPVEAAEPLEGRSELIELPRLAPRQKTQANTDLPVPTRGVSHLRDVPLGGSRGQGSTKDGFGTDFEGQGVNILQRVVPTVDVSKYGTVTMQFRLSSEGRVMPESISVSSFTASEYLQASMKALEQWRFSFLGRYDPNKIYKITFVFNPS